MLERQGSESKTQKLLPLSSNPRFSWVEWKAYLFIFAATIVLGKEARTHHKLCRSGRVRSCESGKAGKIRCGERLDSYGHLLVPRKHGNQKLRYSGRVV